jgi:hypothetical protein
MQGKRARSEASRQRPAGHGLAADATDPHRTSRIPTPQGGWVGQRTEKEWGWGLSQPCPPPPPPGGEPLADPRRNRGHATMLLILSVTPNQGLTHVNPPDCSLGAYSVFAVQLMFHHSRACKLITDSCYIPSFSPAKETLFHLEV